MDGFDSLIYIDNNKGFEREAGCMILLFYILITAELKLQVIEYEYSLVWCHKNFLHTDM